MQYRKLGSSDLSVSEIALGSWLTYSGGIDKARSLACVRRALELGINFIDTANIYGRGAAETLLGEALAGVPRQSYVLATKLFFPMSEADRGLSRAQIKKQLDASLARLARRAGSGSPSGRSTRSRPRKRCRGSPSSCRASPSIRCSGAGRKRSSSRCVPQTASRRSCGPRSRKVC
jgi:hypothetical protein